MVTPVNPGSTLLRHTASGGPAVIVVEASSTEGTSGVGPVQESSNPDQLYFWTEEWQEGERTAEEDIESGRVTWISSADDLDSHFDPLMNPPSAEEE